MAFAAGFANGFVFENEPIFGRLWWVRLSLKRELGHQHTYGRANLPLHASPGILGADERQLGGIVRAVPTDCATDGEEFLLFLPGHAA